MNVVKDVNLKKKCLAQWKHNIEVQYGFDLTILGKKLHLLDNRNYIEG